MSRLDDIPVQVILGQENADQVPGSIIALLHEISGQLNTLINEGIEGQVELMGLLSEAEREALKSILGQGEVSATLDTLGQSHIYETLIPGVWWISHSNADQQAYAESIEITHMPEILKSDPAEMRNGLEALNEQLAELAENNHAIGEQDDDEQRRNTG